MKMNFVFASDDRGANMMAVAIYSVIKNNSKNVLKFHIIHSGISTENLARLKKLEASFDNTSIKFYKVDANGFKDIETTNKNVTPEAYYRYLAPELISKKENRALYMDFDMLCLDELSDLYSTDLGNNSIGAVPDYFVNHGDAYSKFRNWLKVENIEVYVNSGLILMDLESMRPDMGNFWNNVRSKNKLIPAEFNIFADQTIANLTFRNKTLTLGKKYNAFATRLADLKLKSASVVHFTGYAKPLTFRDKYSSVYDTEYFLYYWEVMNIIGHDSASIIKFAVNKSRDYERSIYGTENDALKIEVHELNKDIAGLRAEIAQLLEDRHQLAQLRGSLKYHLRNLPYSAKVLIRRKLS